jgi:hypothetical protein
MLLQAQQNLKKREEQYNKLLHAVDRSPVAEEQQESEIAKLSRTSKSARGRKKTSRRTRIGSGRV